MSTCDECGAECAGVDDFGECAACAESRPKLSAAQRARLRTLTRQAMRARISGRIEQASCAESAREAILKTMPRRLRIVGEGFVMDVETS